MKINENKTQIKKVILLDNLKTIDYLEQTEEEIYNLEIKKFLKISKLKEEEEYLGLKTQKAQNDLEKSIKNPFNLVLKGLKKEKRYLENKKEKNQIFMELIGF